jgi:hypothetical protein
MSNRLMHLTALAIVACNPAKPPPAPPPAIKEAADPTPSQDASTTNWVDVDCSALLKSDDVAAICNRALKLDSLLPDRSERTIQPAFDLNPATRVTCARA